MHEFHNSSAFPILSSIKYCDQPIAVLALKMKQSAGTSSSPSAIINTHIKLALYNITKIFFPPCSLALGRNVREFLELLHHAIINSFRRTS